MAAGAHKGGGGRADFLQPTRSPPGPTPTNRHWSVLASAPRAGNETSGHAEVCAVGQDAMGRRGRASGLPAPGVFALSPRASGYGERRTNGLARATECTSPMTMWSAVGCAKRRGASGGGWSRDRVASCQALPGVGEFMSLSLSLSNFLSLSSCPFVFLLPADLRTPSTDRRSEGILRLGSRRQRFTDATTRSIAHREPCGAQRSEVNANLLESLRCQNPRCASQHR